MQKINKSLVLGYICALEQDIEKNCWRKQRSNNLKKDHRSTPVIVDESGATVKTLKDLAVEIYCTVSPSPWEPYDFKAFDKLKKEWA